MSRPISRPSQRPEGVSAAEPLGAALFCASLAAAATAVMAALAPGPIMALTVLACLSAVVLLATFRLGAPPESSTVRRVLATLLSAGVTAAFLMISATPLALLLPTGASTVTALVGRSRFFTLSALLVATSSGIVVLAG